MATAANKFVSPQKPKLWTAVATTAETAFHSPTNVVTLIDDTLNPDGALVESLYAITRAQISGAPINCQLYKKVGTTYTLINSVQIGIVSPSASVANGQASFGYSPETTLKVEQNTGLAVAIGTTIANGVAFVGIGGSYTA